MLRRVLLSVACFAALFATVGCQKPTPEEIKLTCNLAGQASALAWVAIEQPKQDEIDAVKIVLTVIKVNVTEYPAGGFKVMIPTIDAIIAKEFPGTDERSIALRKMAHLLTVQTLTRLDILFDAHPAWKTKGAEVAGYVGAFCEGGLDALSDFKEKSRMRALERVAEGKLK